MGDLPRGLGTIYVYLELWNEANTSCGWHHEVEWFAQARQGCVGGHTCPYAVTGARQRLAEEPARITTRRGFGEPAGTGETSVRVGHVICDPRGQGWLPGLWQAPDTLAVSLFNTTASDGVWSTIDQIHFNT